MVFLLFEVVHVAKEMVTDQHKGRPPTELHPHRGGLDDLFAGGTEGDGIVDVMSQGRCTAGCDSGRDGHQLLVFDAQCPSLVVCLHELPEAVKKLGGFLLQPHPVRQALVQYFLCFFHGFTPVQVMSSRNAPSEGQPENPTT